jgi:mono/diheme cytochrome c family protein
MLARMTRRALPTVSLVVVTAWVGSAYAQPGPFMTAADYSGAELFLRFCAACHGESAQGDGPVAGSFAAPVPDLTRLSARRGGEFPANEVREVIDGRSPMVAHGLRQMPVWGYEFWIDEGADRDAEARSREIIARLVAYLADIQVP